MQDLEKALAGQEPYIARLEAQLEMQMGASNGHLGSTTKRRSGIPVVSCKLLIYHHLTSMSVVCDYLHACGCAFTQTLACIKLICRIP